MIAALGRALGTDLGGPYDSPAAVLDAIRSEVPGYVGLAVPGFRSASPVPASATSALEDPGRPVVACRTLRLDAIEARFEDWLTAILPGVGDHP